MPPQAQAVYEGHFYVLLDGSGQHQATAPAAGQEACIVVISCRKDRVIPESIPKGFNFPGAERLIIQKYLQELKYMLVGDRTGGKPLPHAIFITDQFHNKDTSDKKLHISMVTMTKDQYTLNVDPDNGLRKPKTTQTLHVYHDGTFKPIKGGGVSPPAYKSFLRAVAIYLNPDEIICTGDQDFAADELVGVNAPAPASQAPKK